MQRLRDPPSAPAMLATALTLLLAAMPAASEPDLEPIVCTWCEAWNRPQEPFRIHGRSWYVGTRGLAAVLIDSGEGLVLLDGALPQSVPLILANIVELGFPIADLRWILNSHAHFDHAGGIAALARISGASVAASRAGAEALLSGGVPADDPQYGLGAEMAYPAPNSVVVIGDGESIRLGEFEITAHYTPGHTPGGTSWSWRSCEEGECLTMVYADSLNPVSAPDFRFFDGEAPRPAASQLSSSIERIAAIDCQLLVSVHPSFSSLFEKHAARADAADTSPFIQADACRRYADQSAVRLRVRQEEETGPDSTGK